QKRKIEHRVGIVRRGFTWRQSRHGLDWMNFFLADLRTAFGTFVAIYLADLGWSKGPVGWSAPLGVDRYEAVQLAICRACSSSKLTGLLYPSAEWRRLAL